MVKTVSLIDGECVGVELTLLEGLTVNVVAPASAIPGSNLPVVIVSSILSLQLQIMRAV